MKQKNQYDIIIENITKEWMISMNRKIPKEKWEVPLYSKSEINKAGVMITNLSSTSEERSAALSILNNWRAAHAYPLHVICSNLRLRNPDAIVVQRLKRLESITGKIERFPNMNLYRMQDLGGCRVIVDTIEQVYESLNKYKTSRIRHILKRKDDYIKEPKKSGYRSYHMVYQFQSDKKSTYNNNMLIEIQFRTKLQHIWATAVEMMGIYTKSNLKASIGNKEILRFFVLVSSVFAKMEGTPVCPDTEDNMNTLISEIKEIDKNNNIISALSSLNVIIDKISDKNQDMYNKNGYYILILDYKEGKVTVIPFKTSNIELATGVYNGLESNSEINNNIVLVSANSFDSLKAAYQNYFTDISEFINMMRKILI